MVAEIAETEPDEAVTLHQGDCLEVLRTMPDESVHAVVTDPPYGLSSTTPEQVARCLKEWASGNTAFVPAKRGGFMGKDWDSFVPPPAVWEECYRVLKPGGHLLAFAGSRTQDLMGMSVRMAGFDIRDSFAWLYGSGFPKSMDVSKAIDKANGDPTAFREFARAYASAVAESPMSHADIDRHLGIKTSSCYWAREDHRGGMPPRHHWETVRSLLDLDSSLDRLYREAERVDREVSTPGENAVFSPTQRVVNAGTPQTASAQQWEGWGTALKPAFEPVIMARKPFKGTVAANVLEHGTGAINIDASRIETTETLGRAKGGWGSLAVGADDYGRFNSIGVTKEGGRFPANVLLDESQAAVLDEQSGGASRFFYCAKAPKSERPKVDGVAHPTVKPLTLLHYLVRMVTPPGGVVLDPFAGTGTTLQAARDEGFHAIGIEAQAEYIPLAKHRLG